MGAFRPAGFDPCAQMGKSTYGSDMLKIGARAGKRHIGEHSDFRIR